MSRSLKKGPFADAHLLKRLMPKRIKIRRCYQDLSHVVQRFSLALLATQSLFTMAVRTFQYIFKKTLVGHKLGEFVPTRTFRGHAGTDKKMLLLHRHRLHQLQNNKED